MAGIELFQAPEWLWLALPAGLLLWLGQRAAPGAPRDWRRPWRLAFRVLTLALLILALAGLRWPGEARSIRVAAAVDLSASIYDRAVQDGALRELCRNLAPANAHLSVLVFGRDAALEKQPGPLGPLSAAARGEPAGTALQLPDLRRPQSAFSPEATDIGAALDRARGVLQSEDNCARAIVLISDGLDTAGRAQASASALNGSGVDLLAWPTVLGGGGDVYVAAMRLPARGRVGAGLPVEVSLGGRQPGSVRVRLGRRVGRGLEPVGSQVVELRRAGQAGEHDFRATVRIVDHPQTPGVAVYVAAVEGPDGQPLPGDYRENNLLHALARVEGPARWAVLARPDSTLARWAGVQGRPLGAELILFTPGRFPAGADSYHGFTGALVEDLSATDLAPESPALSALAAAVRGGLALAATGGEQAFGAGGHPEGGEWERLLPVTMRPEDDRTRSLLFVLDASHSMNDQTAQGVKLHFARAQIGQVLQDARAVRPTDRLGLLVFSGRARLAAPMSGAEGWKEFLEALAGVRTEDRTHFLAALELARRTLAEDRSEQQIVIFISDGVPVPGVVDEELKAAVEALCRGPVAPGGARRTVLHTFGIGTGPADSDPQGLRRLREMARAGGGECFPNFMELAASLGRLLRQAPPDFYVRREPFGTRPVQPIHPLVRMMGEDWPELPFRNRLKARPEASVLLESAPRPGAPADGPARRPDPLLALGHCAAARTAALALSLQGEAGRAFLAPQGDWPGGQKLLAALLSWLEGEDRGLRSGWRIEAEPEDEKLSVRLTAEDPGTRAPLDGLNLSARLAPLGGTAPAGMAVALLPVAPGRYEAQLPLPARDMRQGEGLPDAWRLEVIEEGRVAAEQFVTVPYPAEYRRFGTDRLALEALVRLAGGRSRLINLPEVDLRAWLKELGPQREYRPARPVLLVLAALCLLCEVVVRGMRRRVV